MKQGTESFAANARWMIYYLAWVVLGVLFSLFVPLADMVEGMPRPVAGGMIDLGVSLYALGLLAPIAILGAQVAPFRRERWGWAIAAHVFGAVAFTLLHWALVYGIMVHALDVHMPGIAGGRGRGPVAYPTRVAYSLLRHAGISFIGYWLVVGLWHAFDTSRKLRLRELQASQLETQLATARLQALRDQLHPHFLFNTLNTVSSLIYEDVRAADKVIRDLSALLRLALDNAGAHTVSLADEVSFVELYLEIMKTRYPDRLRVEIRVDPAAATMAVPNLLLQPIVENSIKHGLESVGGAVDVRVDAAVVDGRLRIDVTDNGPGLRRDAGAVVETGVGLRNTRDRLVHLYGDEQSFEIGNRDEGGVRVRIVLPARPLGEEAT